VIGVFGVGGLGSYAVQYAKILGCGARVIAFARNPDKLAVAKDYGADHVISVRNKTTKEIATELSKATGQGDLDAIIDCAGAPEMMQMGFGLLGIGGHYTDVGFIGDRIDIPLFPRVSREQTFHGSFWGNSADLTEVMALAAQDKIRHTIKTIAFEQINEYLDLLRTNKVVGRAVVKL
jgi:alcohol dehydrogenase, propanol-preferring